LRRMVQLRLDSRLAGRVSPSKTSPGAIKRPSSTSTVPARDRVSPRRGKRRSDGR
jgi:hypothetical protein